MFQTPFGITACESTTSNDDCEFTLLFQTPFGITACESARHQSPNTLASSFKRLSASLHVKVTTTASGNRRVGFQTPFGITACESEVRIFAENSFHDLFQTPFGITACESTITFFCNSILFLVSNAFRHHCM